MPQWFRRLACLLLPLLLVLPTLLALAGLDAQAAPIEPSTSRLDLEPAASANLRAEVDETKPLPVPEPSALAIEYQRTGLLLWIFARFWDLAVPLTLLLTGASARLAAFAKRTGRYWFLTVGLYIVIYLGIVLLLDLPLRYYAGFLRAHAYGLSNQTFGKWFGDLLKSEAVDMFSAFCLVWVPMLLIDRRPRSWWWIMAALMVPFLYFVMFVTPIFIDPLYNDFGPMKNQALEKKILALAESAGIEGGRVYEVNKSVDTKAMNAYVTGLLKTKRIVLWDTLLSKLDDREVLVVMGHEMGHYVLNHVAWSVALSSLILIASLFWVDRAGRWVIRRYGARIGFERLGDIAAIPLLIVLIQISSLVLAPVALAYSRHNEAEADRFTLELTRMNHSGATAFAALQSENLGIPYSPWITKVWRGSHPSLGERIEFCNAYHPWRAGEPLRYQAFFSTPITSPAETAKTAR